MASKVWQENQLIFEKCLKGGYESHGRISIQKMNSIDLENELLELINQYNQMQIPSC